MTGMSCQMFYSNSVDRKHKLFSPVKLTNIEMDSLIVSWTQDWLLDSHNSKICIIFDIFKTERPTQLIKVTMYKLCSFR